MRSAVLSWQGPATIISAQLPAPCLLYRHIRKRRNPATPGTDGVGISRLARSLRGGEDMKAPRVDRIPLRKDRILRAPGGDAYESSTKLPPTRCVDCGIFFVDGRWQDGEPPPGLEEGQCPACRRIADKYPAGTVQVSGPFYSAHTDEILRLVHNTEQHARAEHPLQRIMSVDRGADAASITTTDVHLARAIGTALHHAYQGELKLDYGQGDKTVRVQWSR